MEQVIQTVEQIRLISAEDQKFSINLDRGLLQGREAIFEQLVLREDVEFASIQTDSILGMIERMITKFQSWAQPYQLPADYLFFLKYFGGLWLETETAIMVLDGTGPMLEDWYTSLMGDNAISVPNQDGVLTIGFLSFRNHTPYDQVYLLLDLAGVIQPNAVLGIPVAASIDYKPKVIVKHLRELPTYWSLIAPSFTAFLERVATTKGDLGYV